MDQGLFALSNFLLNILLARWLAPEEYGAFAVAYAIFLLLGVVHTGILTEPMQVFGPGKHKERLADYLYVLVKGHIVFGTAGSLLFAGGALTLWLYTESPLTPAIGGLAFALPFILFQWLLRRACYVRMSPDLAARAGMLYMVLMLAGLFGLYRADGLGSASALAVMGTASFLSGLWLLYRLRSHRAQIESELSVQQTINDHWRYGRWAIAVGVLSWVPGNVAYLLLPIWHGLEAVAALRVLNNLVMPALQINAALAGLLLPAMVSQTQRDRAELKRFIQIIGAIVTAWTALHFFLISLFAEQMLVVLFGEQYRQYAVFVWLLALLPITAGLVVIYGAALRALEKPEQVFAGYSVATTAALTVGVGLVWAVGVAGAIVSLVLTSVLTAGILRLNLKSHLDVN